MDCSRKGLKKVVIKGALGEAYVAELLNKMDKQSIDFTTRQWRKTAQNSQCYLCSLPDGDDLQVEDKPKELSGHTCDRRCSDASCSMCAGRFIGCPCST